MATVSLVCGLCAGSLLAKDQDRWRSGLPVSVYLLERLASGSTHRTRIRCFLCRGIASNRTHAVRIGLLGGAQVVKEFLVKLSVYRLYLIGIVKCPFSFLIPFSSGVLQHLRVHFLELMGLAWLWPPKGSLWYSSFP